MIRYTFRIDDIPLSQLNVEENTELNRCLFVALVAMELKNKPEMMRELASDTCFFLSGTKTSCLKVEEFKR